MNRALETRFTEAQTLSDPDQTRLAEFVGDFIDNTKGTDQFQDEMKDPDYRAYVEGALAEGEADIQAGRFTPLQDVFTPKIEQFKAKHGL